jgi:hypothetical protein
MPPSTPNPAPDIRDHDRWNSGDFALVTPDGVRLLIEKRHLRSAR